MEAKTEFDKLMRDAVAIKSAQLAQYRRKFDQWPQFHQAGLYYCDSYKSLHHAPLSEILPIYTSKKQEGTQLFQEKNYQSAIHKYEEVLTMFRWVENRNEKWRNSGIEDDDLTVHMAEKTKDNVEMMVALYLNIAICNLKLEVWKEAVSACDEALELDSENVKALYRKALGLTVPAGSDLDHYKEAIVLLSKALKIEPSNLEVREKLQEYKVFLKDQKKKSKETFGSFFKKASYSDAKPGKNEEGAKEYEELIQKGENMVKDLKAKGKKQEARKLEKNVKLMKTHKAQALEKARKQALDFENPTEEMVKSAKEFGIDLNDPFVQDELKKLKEGKNLSDSSEDEQSEKIQKKSSNGILKPSPNPTKLSIWDKKWIILGVFIIGLGFYLYNPGPSELW